LDRPAPVRAPGRVIYVDPKGVRVAAGRDSLLIQRLQLEGEAELSAALFAAGRLGPGDSLGDP
jgi:methionyl-tRNA formyltransferase